MTYDELLRAEPTESEATSLEMVRELIAHPTWRCYSSKTYQDTDSLINRFMKNQARVKGVVSDEMYAEIPAAIFHLEQSQTVVRGALYLNGAVLVSRTPDGTIIRSLFVDDETAQQWGYPEGYVSNATI